MAKRTTKAEKSESQQGKEAKSGASGGAVREDDESQTGMPDPHYNLVSVLYHALQGATLYAEYAEDAEAMGDPELTEFFRDLQEDERERADRAKEYLLERLTGAENDDDDEEEEESASA